MENTYTTIIRPVVTEKSSVAQTANLYTFLINKGATKIDVKKAIKALYDVDVVAVKTSVTPRKTRLIKGRYEYIKRPNYKKAIVSLKKGQTIDPNKLKFAKDKQ